MVHNTEYKPAKFHFTEAQIHKIKHRHGVRVAHHQIGKGPHTLFLHPHVHHKLSMNHAKGKGMDLAVTDGELAHTIESGIEGTGIWDSIKSGFNKYVKPVLSGVGDAIAYANPELAPLREGVRGLTGVGLKHSNGFAVGDLRSHAKHHAKKEHPHEHHYGNYDSEKHRNEEHHVMNKKAHKKRITKHGNGLYL